jgi:hypothetical protein
MNPSNLISSGFYLNLSGVIGHWKLVGSWSLANRMLQKVRVRNVIEAGVRNASVE